MVEGMYKIRRTSRIYFIRDKVWTGLYQPIQTTVYDLLGNGENPPKHVGGKTMRPISNDIYFGLMSIVREHIREEFNE